MLEAAKVWGSQDELDTDSGVSIREELMDFLHLSLFLGLDQDQNHDKQHLEVQKRLTLPPKRETCKQQRWELSTAAQSAPQERKNPGRREG